MNFCNIQNYKKQVFFTIFLLFISTTSMLAQTLLTGVVENSENSIPVPFANVVLFHPNDTLNYITGFVSDLNGTYIFENIAPGVYTLKASHVGYRLFEQRITVTGKKREVFDIQLTEGRADLNEVEVLASRSQRGIDKTTFRVIPEDIEKSKNSLDLVEIVPSISINRLNRTIANFDGKPIKILINGMNATERDLIALQPEQVEKIEHFDFPPARFANYGSVINVVTVKPQNGGVAGLDLQHAFTTGFGNDDVYFKYQKGQNLFSISYALRYRDYSKRYTSEVYKYQFNDTFYQRRINSRGKFGYTENLIDLGYIRQNNDKYALQLRFSPNFNTRYSKTATHVTNSIDQDQIAGVGNYSDDELMFNPVLDAYFWLKTSDKSTVIVNVVGTGFYSENNLNNLERNAASDTLLYDRMKSNIDKNSIIGETVFSRNVGSSILNVGYRFFYSESENYVQNIFNNPVYRTTNISNYIYSEVKGKFGQLTYASSVGLTNSNFSENFAGNVYNRWIFRPTIRLGYNFNQGRGLKLIYASNVQEPSLSQLSSNRILIAPKIVQQGNPELDPFRGHGFALGFFNYSKTADIEISGLYGWVPGYITTRYIQTNDFIALIPIDEYDIKAYSIEYSCVFKPRRWINIRINGSVSNERYYNSNMGDESHFSYPMNGSINFYYNRVWVLTYQQTLVSESLDGPYLISSENGSNIGISYQGKPIYASLRVFWPFTHAKYARETVQSSIVTHQRNTRIMDNASMITFSIGYNFQFGEQIREKQRQINNKDTDSGVFLK